MATKTKTLGALLGKEQDVARRMQLAGLAFHRMLGLFVGVGASLELKICMRNALVRPVMHYTNLEDACPAGYHLHGG